MLRGKGFLVLVVVTALAVVGAMYSLERKAPQPQVGELLFPELLDAVNDVTEVVVTSAGQSFSLRREGNRWVAPDRGGYPLEPDKVHKLLVGTAGLERLEPKTSDPARFEELGLRDPTDEESRAVRFELRGAKPVSLIVGERRPAKGDPSRTEYFVRVPGEVRSWLVRGSLPHDAGEVVDWLDKRIARIDAGRIQRVRVQHSDGEVVTALRKPEGETGYRYAELPEGQTVRDPWKVNDLGRLVTDLSLDEVRPAGNGSPDAPAVTVTADTVDGLRIVLALHEEGEAAWATLSASWEASVAEEFRELRPEGAPDADAVRTEAAELDARWKPWAYRLPGFKADTARYRRADLLPPEDTGTGAQPPG